MTHWKKLTNPNYLGAYSIDDGKDLILTIKSVANEMVIGADGKKEECVVAHFVEHGTKPMILNSTNMKMISKLFGTPFIEQWISRKIQIGTERVKAFGEVTDALRVRNKLPSATQEKYICEDCGNEIKPLGKRSAQEIADYTKGKYGNSICSDCATKRNETVQTETDKPNDERGEQENNVEE
jgi:hypothetical protein